MHFAEATADTAVLLKNFRFSVFTGLNDLLRTKGYTDAAGFAPVMIERDFKPFFFLRGIVFHTFILIYNRALKAKYTRKPAPAELYIRIQGGQPISRLFSSLGSSTKVAAELNRDMVNISSSLISFIFLPCSRATACRGPTIIPPLFFLGPNLRILLLS